jgi:hypothetical protein
MKLALQAALVVLLAIAIYYRLVRHDPLKYYLLFPWIFLRLIIQAGQ